MIMKLCCIYQLCFACLGVSPDGWINTDGTNECYLFAKDGPGVTWNQAKDYCRSIGGTLASIYDQKTQDFLKKYHDPEIFWWLGGTKESNVNVYHYNLKVVYFTICLPYAFNFLIFPFLQN